MLKCLLLIFSLILIIIIYNYTHYFNCTKHSLNENNVLEHYKNPDIAAKKIKDVKELSQSVIDILKIKLKNNSIPQEKRAFVTRLVKKYNQSNIVENTPDHNGETSFVKNKGEKIGICVRDHNNNFHNNNIIEFVTLHELTHIGTKKYGHGPLFWSNFKYILHIANLYNIHSPVDYSVTPSLYCGKVNVSSNPFYF